MRFLPLILLIPLFAGCLDEGTSPPPWTPSEFAVPCQQRDPCIQEAQADGRTAWVVQDLQLPGLLLNPTGSDLIIVRNVTLEAPTSSPWGKVAGIRFHDVCTGCEVIIEDARLVGPGHGSGVLREGVAAESVSRLVLRNVTIGGFETGLDMIPVAMDRLGFTNSVLVDGVTIDCLHVGAMLRLGHFEATGLTIRGCRSEGAYVEMGGDGFVTNSHFSDSDTGFELHAGGKVLLTESTFHNNSEFGLNVQPGGRVEMTGLTVTDNGHRGRSQVVAGIVAWPEGFVHDSTIAGNAFGLLEGVQSGYDATTNYWGDANGPRLCHNALPVLVPVGIGEGDCVGPNVRTTPHRASPP